MAAHWDIAACIVALFAILFSVSPAAVSIIQTSLRQTACIVLPSRGRCYRILWSDMPQGRLHMCDPHDILCQHQPISPPTAQPHNPINCWEDTIGKVFNRFWPLFKKDPVNPSYTVNKPNQLPLSRTIFRPMSKPSRLSSC